MSQYSHLKRFITDVKFGGKKEISIPYVTSCHTVYFNAQHLFLQLKPMERCYFDFLVESSQKDGFVLLDKVLKDQFLEHLVKVGGGKIKLPSPKGLHNTTVKLVDLGLLIRTTKKAEYYINPKYVCVTAPSKRMELIEKMFRLAEQGLIIPSPLLDKPIEEYFGDPEK
ncbi:MAG: hypothetical protein P8O16_06910 [Algoriphagus sp.]|uniref:hypothetical protein n=1 Tax=Algoriphagus sp. TaxID=1872435 RepID=UPI00260AC74B|nr:hypothetical protein [Algoriphagus sp.]MDG1276994.1 hypothetical protein [Algoriphagus sp.]